MILIQKLTYFELTVIPTLNKKPSTPAPSISSAVEFTSEPEPQTVAEAPKEMIDSILGKSPSKSINDELISLNARAMKITTVEEGTAISDEYRKMKAAHGEENLPKSLREVVVSSLNAARDKITRDKLA